MYFWYPRYFRLHSPYSLLHKFSIQPLEHESSHGHQINECGCVPVKLYLQKQEESQIRLAGNNLPTCGLDQRKHSRLLIKNLPNLPGTSRACPFLQVTLPTPADQTRDWHLAGAGPKAFPGDLKLPFVILVPVFSHSLTMAREV